MICSKLENIERLLKITIFLIQTMAILSAMIGNARFFPVQFNENAAW